ncbi:MAG: DNA gyrase inhibitor YacG [Candidatus Brocadiia bacterium]
MIPEFESKARACPICGKRSTDETGRAMEFFPFCSKRCKLVDLNNWLTGSYFGEEPGQSDDGEPRIKEKK